MAETVGLSRACQPRNGAIGFVGALKQAVAHLVSGRRSSRLVLEEWPDYLLRDIGLDRTTRDSADPRALPIDWPLR